MIVSNPQWQGAGNKRLIAGNKSLRKHFETSFIYDIPLSDELESSDGVNYFKAIQQQSNSFREVLETHQPSKLLTLGGDCGIETMPVSYLNLIYPGLGVIWFDAHADLNTPSSSPSGNFHGMPLGVLCQQPAPDNARHFSVLNPRQIHYLGLRDIDPFEKQYIEEHDISVQTTIHLDLLLAQLKPYQNLYVHFDVDALDPHEFAHSFYQVQEGLSVATCSRTLELLSQHFNIVGGSITEVTADSVKDLEAIEPLLDWYKAKLVQGAV